MPNGDPNVKTKPSLIREIEEAFPNTTLKVVSQVSPTPLQQFAREMGARGGRIGGKRRMETMTPEQRSKIAKKAAKARWAKVKSKSKSQPKSKEGK